jgi:hypothetical protein
MIEEIIVPPPPIFRILYNTTKLAGLEQTCESYDGTGQGQTKYQGEPHKHLEPMRLVLTIGSYQGSVILTTLKYQG